MPEPVTLAIISSSVRLLSSGLKLAIWDGGTAWPAHDRLGWLAKLLELNSETLTSLGGLLKHLGPATARPELAAQLWAVNVACFGEALSTYWGGNRGMIGDGGRWGKWFAPSWVRERKAEVDAALGFALDLLQRSPAPVLPSSSWLATPTASPLYKALWTAFTAHEILPGGVALLPLDQDGDVQAFERAFSQAFREAMARAGNTELRTLLSDGIVRGEALRELLLADMASWRHQHVFAGVDTSEGIPELPLGTTYVEPNASIRLGKATKTAPVLELLRELLGEHRIIFVTADFGHGKSLTARTLAWQWAKAYLEPSPTPNLDRFFPIHIRCASDASNELKLDTMVKRALKRRANEIGVPVKVHDDALVPPPEQRAVYLLDGLDEINLSERQIKELVDDLFEYTGDHRFIVFSRPEALPRRPAAPGQPVIPHVQINSFSEEQTNTWLSAWPGEVPSREDLDTHELNELAAVPILLFMLTLSWPKYKAKEGVIPRVQIYESFFQTLAAGKYEKGGETHPKIRAAAEQARDALVACKELPVWRGEAQGSERAIEAMQWLMDRIAWEARRLEFAGEEVSRHDIDHLLRQELSLPVTTLEQVRVGLLLGMQAQLAGENQQFLFGHRSFMEFAIARYWERQLKRACDATSRELENLEDRLTGAPLIPNTKSRVFPFLCEMLAVWGKKDCKKLFKWATLTVADESVRAIREPRYPTFRNDVRTLVRQSALAIGCQMGLRLKEPFEIADGSMLLTVTAWWILVKGHYPEIVAPGLHVDEDSCLVGYSCPGVDLEGARLDSVNFTRARLEIANLEGAHLERVNFDSACLKGANLKRAYLEGANLSDADLGRAYLEHAHLEHAHLVDARLERADLSNASLRGAFLMGANLVDANLMGANLDRADFSYAFYNSRTRWPAGFVPPETAILVIYETGGAPDE